MNRVCIYGAGAIGGWIGAALAAQGCAVSVVARGATLQALRSDGLRVARGEQVQTQAVHASADPSELGVQDLVVVAVKAPAMPEVARRIGPLLGPDTIVLTAMNGVPWWFLQGLGGEHGDKPLRSVDPGGEIARAIAARHVLGCVVHASCALDGPGRVRHVQGNKLIIGEPSGRATPRAAALQGLLLSAGFEAVLSDGIQRDAWFKLWGNMTMNPISAITGADTAQVLDDELVRGFITSVMREAREIGARLGIPIAQEPEERHAVTRKLGAFKTSMLQDVEAGRPLEIDALIGAVHEIARRVGVPTPNIDALFGLVRLMARSRGLSTAA